ncbi:HEPN/Toprim-associated domain-containing protein [Aliarcobacter cryaerophilus]|uniref:HEPN/Toprim-associated domain-containing protein n=1 Tax=Aliarcobacter cryaerophilus TaxID=28198 RepID=UPI00112F76E1|nr:HEPN/Toprim-associated domain-containing protein [Aliarcobacter cryaerophilus]
MGSYTELTIDEYPVYSSKSYVPSDICYIFCESDKKIFNRKINERNKIVWGNLNEEDLEMAYEYQTIVQIAIDRLEIMGYSLNNTQQDFITSKNKEIEELTDLINFSDTMLMNHFYMKKIELLKKSDFNHFIEAFIEIRAKEVPYYKTNKDYNLSELAQYLIEDGWFLNFPCSEFGFYYRAFLESCDKNALVIQDITEVTNAGYYLPEEKIINSLMENQEKITILTEGSTDINIISKSIKLLYPHLFDYYNCKDFKNSKAQGNAHQLFLDIKNLIAMKYKGKIIALFDNDGEGLTQYNQLKKINIPKNIVVLKYPDIELLKNYPTTIGSFGNLNGIAGSIEMYLGEDILKENEEYIHIELANQKIPHGVIKYKDNIQKKYFKKINKCENDISCINDYNWNEMKLLLNTIFGAFKDIKQ